MKINLHEHTLEQAKIRIFNDLAQCWKSRDSEIEIVHGHIHGTVLKDYIESVKFLNEADENGFILVKRKDPNPGSSKFHLNILPAQTRTKKIEEVGIESFKNNILEIFGFGTKFTANEFIKLRKIRDFVEIKKVHMDFENLVSKGVLKKAQDHFFL